MSELINYIGLSTLYLIVFYLFFQVLLSGDTLYSRNRFYLLFTLIFSLVLPLIKFNIPLNSGLGTISRSITAAIHIGQVDVIGGEGSFPFSHVSALFILYIAGVIVSGTILVINLISIRRQISKSPQHIPGVVFTENEGMPGFAALGYIFISNHLGEDDVKRIANHERKHLEYRHFYDILLVRIISIFLWFNPIIYLFERSLRAVHEYQVDDNLLQNGENLKRYQELMLNQVFRTNIFSVRSAFSGQTLIKKRMIMMTKKKSGKIAELKVFCLLPAIAILMVVFSCKSEQGNTELQAIDEVATSPAGETLVTEKPPPATGGQLQEIQEEEVLVVVEVMPRFQGGDINKFRSYLAQNVKYPSDAMQKGIQGQVFVMFVVDKTGAIRDINITRGVDPSLDAEVIRVVEAAPDWTPGMHKGKNVNVSISTAVNFQLQ